MSKKGIFFAFVGIKLINFIISAIGFVMLAVVAIIIFNNMTEDKSYNSATLLLNSLEVILTEHYEEHESYSFVGTLEEDVYISVFNEYNKNSNKDGADLPSLCKGRTPCVCICQGTRGTDLANERCEDPSQFPVVKCKSKFHENVKKIIMPRLGASGCSDTDPDCLHNMNGHQGSESNTYSVYFGSNGIVTVGEGIREVDRVATEISLLNILVDYINEGKPAYSRVIKLTNKMHISAYNEFNAASGNGPPSECGDVPCICVCKGRSNQRCEKPGNFPVIKCASGFNSVDEIQLPRLGVQDFWSCNTEEKKKDCLYNIEGEGKFKIYGVEFEEDDNGKNIVKVTDDATIHGTEGTELYGN